jgi:hypothetical protein
MPIRLNESVFEIKVAIISRTIAAIWQQKPAADLSYLFNLICIHVYMSMICVTTQATFLTRYLWFLLPSFPKPIYFFGFNRIVGILSKISAGIRKTTYDHI